MKPLVSILIPAYNADAWIGDAIRSAIGQTWPRKEIIVVDDGSRDQTFAVARRFAAKDVVVVTHENQGAAATRNCALSLSQGDFIQWLDADDLLSPDKVEKQIEAAAELGDNRKLLSSGWGYFAYRTEKAKFTPSSLWCDLSPIEWMLRKMGQNLHMQTATWLTSRELTKLTGPWDVRLLVDDDGEYFGRVILASSGIRFVPGSRVFYRITPSSRLSHIGISDNKKKNAMLLSMQLHIKYIRSLEESDRVLAACMSYINTWLGCFYPERPDLVAELDKMAASLGHKLEPPRLRWKYAWIKSLFGWGPAKAAQLMSPQFKSSLLRSWDKALYKLQKRRKARI